MLVGPFVQEDTTILGAAALSANQHGDPVWLFASVLVGLTAADVSKYWIGAALPRVSALQRFCATERVTKARGAVLGNLTKSLFAARLIPGARIPTYVACGLFGADFKRFFVVLTLAGALYIALAFVLVAALGKAGGPYLTIGAPLVVVATLLIGLGAHALRRLSLKSKPLPLETYA